MAAAHLRHMGADGMAHVPTLFEMCGDVLALRDPTPADYGFILSGMRSVGAVLNAYGYDSSEAMHKQIIDWTLDLSKNADNELRATAIWVLGEIGVPPHVVQERLVDILLGGLLKGDHEIATCRSIAFRMLARIDRESASRYLDSAACKEYITSMEHWLNQNAKRPEGNYDRGPELEAERVHSHLVDAFASNPSGARLLFLGPVLTVSWAIQG
ncbi:hypothetical protein [Stieleria neptunia]|uniref:hypothetical protein n=1 Tax=Stieleria neptunia TaxID=2527979 RepID=UPI0011A45B3E|nr:hypothetical protein [Stieleria neptunia]